MLSIKSRVSLTHMMHEIYYQLACVQMPTFKVAKYSGNNTMHFTKIFKISFFLKLKNIPCF